MVGFLLLQYLTENQWDNREERSGNNARAFFDREMLTEKGKEILSNSDLTFDAAAMRFTGTLMVSSSHPSKLNISIGTNSSMP